ncbi:MAG: MFS transporter [Vulcanimicrobiaceae bacterium]
MVRSASIFENRTFRLFYGGQAFSYLGDGLRLIAIPLLVYRLTGSALSLGATYALELGPFAFFGLLGGSLADRIDRRSLMIGCDVVRFAVMAAIAIGYARGTLSLGFVYVGVATLAIAAAVFVGAQSSSIPYLLGKERAVAAMSALLAAEQVSQTVIPPLGGALFALIGPLPALAINAGTYLVSQGSLALAGGFGPDAPGRWPSLRAIGGDIAAGFDFLAHDPALRAFAAISLAFNFFGFVNIATFIPFLKVDFGASDATVGIVLGLGALGSVLGSWLSARVPARWHFGRIIQIAYALDALLFLPVVLTHDLRVVIPFLALSNACVLFEIAHIVGWRIRITPEPLVGRVSAAARLVALLGTVPGALIGGAFADHAGPRAAMMLGEFGYLALAVAIWLVPSIRRERR